MQGNHVGRQAGVEVILKDNTPGEIARSVHMRQYSFSSVTAFLTMG